MAAVPVPEAVALTVITSPTEYIIPVVPAIIFHCSWVVVPNRVIV